jgi:hypothetical protein
MLLELLQKCKTAIAVQAMPKNVLKVFRCNSKFYCSVSSFMLFLLKAIIVEFYDTE